MTSFRLMTLTTVVGAGVAGFAADARADHRYPSCDTYARPTFVETVPVRTVVYTEPVRCREPVRYVEYRDGCRERRPRYVETRRGCREYRPRYVEVRSRRPHRHFRPSVRARFDGRRHHGRHRRGFSLHLRR